MKHEEFMKRVAENVSKHNKKAQDEDMELIEYSNERSVEIFGNAIESFNRVLYDGINESDDDARNMIIETVIEYAMDSEVWKNMLEEMMGVK